MLGIGRRQSGGDPFFSSVVLLALNESGADGGTTFDDQSNSNHALTANGNFQWDTAQAPTGLTSSGLGDGAGDFVSAADHANWYFADGDFAIDIWQRAATSVGVRKALLSQVSGAGARSWSLQWNITNWRFLYSTDGTAQITTATFADTIDIDTWYHVAIARDGANLRCYRDGAQKGVAHNIGTSVLFDANSVLRVGAGDSGTESFNGWLAGVRITNGSNRGYTGTTITVPDLPLPTS